MATMKYAEIAVPVPVYQTYTYEVPPTLIGAIYPGHRVVVPWGQRKITGYVVALKAECDRTELKPIYDLLDEQPALVPDLLALAEWLATYYICPPGEVIKAMLPGGINVESHTYLQLAKTAAEVKGFTQHQATPTQTQILNYLLDHPQPTVRHLRKQIRRSSLGFSIMKLQEAGLISREVRLSKAQAKAKFETYLKLTPRLKEATAYQETFKQLEQSAPVQATCLAIIQRQGDIAQRELLRQSGGSSQTVAALVQKGMIEKYQREVFRSYYSTTTPPPSAAIFLNEHQRRAVSIIDDQIKKGSFKTFLIHGVTGSGKTQVYIEAIRQALAMDKTAIVLVPEIALTPQTVSRFMANFPGQVAVLHSRMSPGERLDSWRRIRQGQFRIAIGPRSAIFAPLERLALIVVDEEQENSYKQMDNRPLYHARDVAVYRGMLNQAVVILGSATPSLESYYNAKIQKYHLLELPERIDNIPLPRVQIVDMITQRKRYPHQNVAIFSKPLQEKILEKLNLKQQIILLQNRRGFSTYIKCHNCGYIEGCTNCNITMTFHLTDRTVRCHYCNATRRAPERCPRCGGIEIQFQGIGTQKVEQEISRLFPQARVVRMDLDTTTRKWSHDKILADFGNGKYDILLGTQMVAKGLDFQNVTLVGVISADTSLLFPDFRASERTFQLLTQVAGRAGRKNLLGEVYIQTYSADNLSLKFARVHDFKSFFAHELPLRRELNYPPFGRLVYILFRGEDERQVQSAAQMFHNFLQLPPELGQVLGPVAAPLSRIQKQYRWQIIIKGAKRVDPGGKMLRARLLEALTAFKRNRSSRVVKINIDIDPISLL